MTSLDYAERFVGHCNTTTDIKEANFFGNNGNFVIAGYVSLSFYLFLSSRSISTIRTSFQLGRWQYFHLGTSNRCDHKCLQRWYGDRELHSTASILLSDGHQWHWQWNTHLDAAIGRTKLCGQKQSGTLRECRANESTSNASRSIRFTHTRHNLSIELNFCFVLYYHLLFYSFFVLCGTKGTSTRLIHSRPLMKSSTSMINDQIRNIIRNKWCWYEGNCCHLNMKWNIERRSFGVEEISSIYFISIWNDDDSIVVTTKI